MNALTNAPNSATDRIRRHLERVTHLRTQAQQDGLSTAVHQIKQLQARRFRATYADFLTDPRHAAATAFFLDELYGEHDFAQRDAQFARIAGGKPFDITQPWYLELLEAIGQDAPVAAPPAAH